MRYNTSNFGRIERSFDFSRLSQEDKRLSQYRGFPEGLEKHKVWEECEYVRVLVSLLREPKEEKLQDTARMFLNLTPVMVNEDYDLFFAGAVFNYLAQQYPKATSQAWGEISNLPEIRELFDSLHDFNEN